MARASAGGALGAGTVDSKGDHRVAMAFAAGAVRAQGPVRILDTANVATSFPGIRRPGQADRHELSRSALAMSDTAAG